VIEILLVEDDPGDVHLIREALWAHRVDHVLNVAEDGVEALEYVRGQGSFADAPRPDIILLDLNLPRMNGREVLAVLKEEPALQEIPVIVLTASDAPEDIRSSYAMNAKLYITKPRDFKAYQITVKAIEEFWLSLNKSPASDPVE